MRWVWLLTHLLYLVLGLLMFDAASVLWCGPQLGSNKWGAMPSFEHLVFCRSSCTVCSCFVFSLVAHGLHLFTNDVSFVGYDPPRKAMCMLVLSSSDITRPSLRDLYPATPSGDKQLQDALKFNKLPIFISLIAVWSSLKHVSTLITIIWRQHQESLPL